MWRRPGGHRLWRPQPRLARRFPHNRVAQHQNCAGAQRRGVSGERPDQGCKRRIILWVQLHSHGRCDTVFRYLRPQGRHSILPDHHRLAAVLVLGAQLHRHLSAGHTCTRRWDGQRRAHRRRDARCVRWHLAFIASRRHVQTRATQCL